MNPAPDNAANTDFKLLYADETLLVLDKPAGLLAVPGRGEDKQDCLSTRVQRSYPEALIVHRLDMATSGLLVMARSTAAQTALGKAFAARQVHKRYVAVVHGVLRQASAPGDAPPDDSPDDDQCWSTIDLPLIADWPNRPLSKVDPENGKPSVTRWRLALEGVVAPHSGLNKVAETASPAQMPAATDAASTRVELEPVTGRTHQLRIHLMAIGHPILGDALYAPPAVQAMAPRLLLHATALRLAHPFSGEALAFHSPAPF